MVFYSDSLAMQGNAMLVLDLHTDWIWVSTDSMFVLSFFSWVSAALKASVPPCFSQSLFNTVRTLSLSQLRLLTNPHKSSISVLLHFKEILLYLIDVHNWSKGAQFNSGISWISCIPLISNLSPNPFFLTCYIHILQTKTFSLGN